MYHCRRLEVPLCCCRAVSVGDAQGRAPSRILAGAGACLARARRGRAHGGRIHHCRRIYRLAEGFDLRAGAYRERATGAGEDEVKRALPDMAWLKTGPLAHLLAVLDHAGEEARVVGGAVRDAMFGQRPHEVDIATTAMPGAVIERVRAAGLQAGPTGSDHRPRTAIVRGMPFEVTTLRADIETFGRKAKVAFGRDWQIDAERRDFTMNALSVDRTGAVFDYVGGLADIDARRVRFIGDPAQRIAEDYLRILRFFRFHATYGQAPPDRAGLAACVAARDGLTQLSRELLYRFGPDRYVDRVLVAWARSPAGAADEDWKNLATLPARWSAPKFPLKAKDFIRRGVERGPQLGAALAGAEQAWIAAGFPLDQRALAELADAAVAATDARLAGDGP